MLRALGIADAQGRIKPTRQAKYRQVEEFLRLLDAAIGDALAKGQLRTPTEADPLRVVDLGCGNAYLTFAAHRYLSAVRGLPVRVTGVDVKQQSADHNTAVAAALGIEADFVVGAIDDAVLPEPPDVVLALHACDTATDDALARAIGWESSLVLAAPCCHHDVAAQLRKAPTPGAVRHAHPARHPARALRRHPHRRAARGDPAAGRLPRRRGRVRRERAHAPQHAAARDPHRHGPSPAARCGASTTTWSPRGGCVPHLAELLGLPRG